MTLFDGWDPLVSAGVAFVVLLILFVPMEKVFPAKAGQKVFRPHWLLDFSFFLGQYLLWSGLVVWALSRFGYLVMDWVPASLQEKVGSQPFWLQAIEVLVISDFLIYWGHRLQHEVEFLWRFHKVHHSAKHMDWLAAHREHPLDSLYTIGLINLPAFIMGFPLEAIAGVIAFRGVWAIFIHSNVKLNLGPLKMLIGSPDLHHWHHDLDRRAGNYANVSPLMDILFGTYTCPDEEPEQFGIKEESPKTYVGQLIEPMLPKKLWKRLTSLFCLLLGCITLARSQPQSEPSFQDTLFHFACDDTYQIDTFELSPFDYDRRRRFVNDSVFVESRSLNSEGDTFGVDTFFEGDTFMVSGGAWYQKKREIFQFFFSEESFSSKIETRVGGDFFFYDADNPYFLVYTPIEQEGDNVFVLREYNSLYRSKSLLWIDPRIGIVKYKVGTKTFSMKGYKWE